MVLLFASAAATLLLYCCYRMGLNLGTRFLVISFLGSRPKRASERIVISEGGCTDELFVRIGSAVLDSSYSTKFTSFFGAVTSVIASLRRTLQRILRI